MKYIVFVLLPIIMLLHFNQLYARDKFRLEIDSTKKVDDHLFFDVLINGERQNKTVGKDGYSNSLSVASTSRTGPIIAYSASIENKNGSCLSVERQGIVFNSPDSGIKQHNKILLENFSPGFYSYATSPLLTKDIVIFWTDNNGKQWNTLLGKQSTSSFQITEMSKSFDQKTGLLDKIIIDCIFSCTLYDELGNKMKLENGRLRYRF